MAVSYTGPDIVEVCYTVDVYGLYNPGIDAATTLGCSVSPPFSVAFNSFWYLNGRHQVVATAFNALGMVVATSSAVSFTIANNWPVSAKPTLEVTTGTALTSPWKGAVTVTATLSGTGHDSLVSHFFIDGIALSSASSTGGPMEGTLYTTEFSNGPHNVCVEVNDTSIAPVTPSGLAMTGVGASQFVGAAGEWCQTVPFGNGAVPTSQAVLNAHEIYLAPGKTFRLTARILNTDGSTTASPQPVFAIADPVLGGYTIAPSTTGAELKNLRRGVAAVNQSTGVVTALSVGAALVNVMTPTISIMDLRTSNEFGFSVCSALHPFTPESDGWLVQIAGGNGWTGGVYQIEAAGNGCATLSSHGFSVVAAPGHSGGRATTGPTRQAWVYVWPNNTYPCYTQDGAVQSSYTSNCMFVNSMFGYFGEALSVMQTDQPYNSPNPICYGATNAAACDFNASAYNTFEAGTYGTITGQENAATFAANTARLVATLETNGLNLYPKFRGLLIGNALVTPQAMWAWGYGTESNASFIGSQTGLQYFITQMMAQGNVLGVSTSDEITSEWGQAPLQGPITFSPNGTNQSALESIHASNGTCAAKTNPDLPKISFIGDLKFSITGSVTPGMNNQAPAVYSALKPSGAAVPDGGVTISGGVVTVNRVVPGRNYFVAPAVSLVGGGGTYTSATATVDSNGHVTGVTVRGAAGYISAPTFIFTDNDFVFSCSGVRDGTYDASNDPRLTVQPYGDRWFNNTGIPYYDVWAKMWNQIKAVPKRKLFFQNPGIGLQSALGFANWGGNTMYPGSQSIGAVDSVADAADLYWPTGTANFIASRQSANTLLQSFDQGYWFRSLYGAYDPDKPLMTLTTATSTYAGIQGYPVPVISCSGNTLTFERPHGITGIIPGLTRLYISGAKDSDRPQDSCNNNFIVYAAPTPTTLTVDLAATDFPLGPNAAVGGTALFADGSEMPIATSTANCGGTCITSSNGTPIASSPINPNIVAFGGFIAGDRIFPQSMSTNWFRKRGQTFTLSGVSGSAASSFNRLTFRLEPENVNTPTVSGQFYLLFHQVPSLNATGGTAYIIPDFNYHHGVSGSVPLHDQNPGWAFGSFMECLFERCSGTRVYKLTKYWSGYSDHLGFTVGAVPLGQFASGAVNLQTYMNQHFENAHSVPTFHAINAGMQVAISDAKYFLTPALNSPDCGFMFECAARSGAAGAVFFAMNLTDGPQSFSTPSLRSYETSGQQIIRKVVNFSGIGALTILPAGTERDSITLQPLDAVIYTFPKNFESDLHRPELSVRLADVPNAADIVIHFAYDPYYLDSAPDRFDCGAGNCVLPADTNIGTVYYRVLYLGRSGEVLATSDVQTL